jgi:hypothetical protein
MKTFRQYIAHTSPELISENILLKLLPWILGPEDAVFDLASPAGGEMLPPLHWEEGVVSDRINGWYELWRNPPGEWVVSPNPYGPWIPVDVMPWVMDRFADGYWEDLDDFLEWLNNPANQDDWDGDGIPNENDPNPGSPFQDSDGDGLADDDPNETDPNDPDVPIPGGLPDSDGDGLPDYLDPDSDGIYDFDIDPNAPDYDPANTDPEIDDPGFVRPKRPDFWKILPSANTEPPEGIG